MLRKTRSYLSISYSYATGALILILLSSAFSTSMAYAQLGSNNSTAITTASPPTTLQQHPNGPSLHLVKITSPHKGQQVPVGKDLLISGTSVDNATSNCKVSVKVNFVSPYHDALPIAEGGQSHYSKWNFTLTSAYTTINPGQNKITAKFSCINNPSLLSHNSVNVTGVPASVASTNVAATTNNSNTNSSTARQISSVQEPPAMTTTPILLNSTSSNTINSNTNSSATLNDTYAPRPLTVSLHLEKNSLHPGDQQTITLLVADKNSTNAITGASVSGRITSPSGQLQKLAGTTDDNGKDSYSWKIPSDYTTGTYKVKIGISAAGYDDYSGLKTFKVTSDYIGHHHHHHFHHHHLLHHHHHHHHHHPSFIERSHSDNSGSDTTTNANHHHHHFHHHHLFTSNTNTNTNSIHHNHPSFIVRPHSSNSGTDTNTNTNTNSIHHNHPSFIVRPHSSNSGTDTNTNTNTNSIHHNHPSFIVRPHSSNSGTDTNTNTNTNHHNYHLSSGSTTETSNLNSFSSIRGSSSSNSVADNYMRNTGHSGPDPNIGGLAQNIMNNVKNNEQLQGIRHH